jgi:purine-cytosine permease-like protein
MTPVVQLYWTRVILGIIAAALSAAAAYLIGGSITNNLDLLLNCITIALIIYLVSYYPLKAMYKNKIEKQSKILSTGVMMYFFAWLPFFILFFTIMKVYF